MPLAIEPCWTPPTKLFNARRESPLAVAPAAHLAGEELSEIKDLTKLLNGQFAHLLQQILCQALFHGEGISP